MLQNSSETKKGAKHNRQQRAKMHTTAPQPLSISAALNKTPYRHSGQRDVTVTAPQNWDSAMCHGRQLPEPRGGTADTLAGTWKAERRELQEGFSHCAEAARAAWDGQKAAHESSEGLPLDWQQRPTACCRARQRKHFEPLQSAFSVATHLSLRWYCSDFIHLWDLQQQILVAHIPIFFSWVSTHAAPLAHTQTSHLETV